MCWPDDDRSYQLAAVVLERRYRSAEQNSSNRAEIRAAIRAELDTSIASLPDARRLLPLYWARARLLSGAHPDDRPSAPDIKQAELDLARARELEMQSKIGPTRRVSITAVRLARLRAAYLQLDSGPSSRKDAIKQARATLGELRDAAASNRNADDDPLEAVQTAFRYEEARLEVVARDWEKASSCLQDVIENTAPTHQAAQVWQIYCRRMKGESADELLKSISSLLHERSAQNKPPPIINEDLRAELRCERAVLVEARDPVGALGGYNEVLERRPRMPFALRGKIRALHMSRDAEGAWVLAHSLRSGDARPEGRLTADVLTEIGQLHMMDRRYEEAVELFDEAKTRLPVYAFAYGRKTAALRGDGDTKSAVRFAERTIRDNAHLLTTLGGLRVELGYSYLASGRVNGALAQFEAAETEKDIDPIVRDRARAGLIRARLWKRDLIHARAAVASRRMGHQNARLEDAAGWFHGTVGLYSKALDHFSRAEQERPYEPSAVVGQARVLRLLGRPTHARGLLEGKAKEWPDNNALLLHSEIGWAAIDERHYKDALESFSSVLALHSKSQPALRGSIVAAARCGFPTSTLQACIASALDQVKTDDPRARASVLTEAGAALLDHGDIGDARQMFRVANDLSDSVSQRLIQGHALLRVHALPEAFERAAEAGRLAAEVAGTETDIAAIGTEATDLANDLIREPENVGLLSVSFDALVGELARTGNGAAAAPRLRALWSELQAAIVVAGVTAEAVKRELLAAFEGLRVKEIQAIDKRARDPDVLLLEGACHLAAAAPELATKAFEDAARAYGRDSLPPVLGQALVLLEQQQYEAACKRLWPFVEEEHGSVRARELFAWSMLHLEQQGDHVKTALQSFMKDRARGQANRPPGDDGSRSAKIVKSCLEIVEEEPSRVDAYVCLGALAMHEGRIAEGLSYLQQAVDVSPMLAHPLLERAAALLRLEDFGQASEQLSEALAIDPHHARAHLLDGLIALAQDQPLAAMPPLRRAQELDPYDPHAALGFATALQQAGRDDEAIAELTRALKTVPPHRSVLLLLARARARYALARTRADPPPANLAAAMTDAVRAAELAQTAHDRAEAEYHRGVILFARHRTRAAGRALRAAIRQDPNHLGARQALAAVRESADDDANARLLRRAAYVTMALASVLLTLILVQGTITAKSQKASFHWTPVAYLALAPLAAIAFAGLLPRIARVRVRDVEITIMAPSSAPETAPTTLDFGRMPLSTLWGPSTYRVTDIVSDLSGLPEW